MSYMCIHIHACRLIYFNIFKKKPHDQTQTQTTNAIIIVYEYNLILHLMYSKNAYIELNQT